MKYEICRKTPRRCKLHPVIANEVKQYRWARDVSLKPLTHLCFGSSNIVEPKYRWPRDTTFKPLTHLCLGSSNIVDPKSIVARLSNSSQ